VLRPTLPPTLLVSLSHSCQILKAPQPRQNPPARSAAPPLMAGGRARVVFFDQSLTFRRIPRRILRSSSIGSSGGRSDGGCQLFQLGSWGPPLAREDYWAAARQIPSASVIAISHSRAFASSAIRYRRWSLPEPASTEAAGLAADVRFIAHLGKNKVCSIRFFDRARCDHRHRGS
jgi:hypothetical protein